LPTAMAFSPDGLWLAIGRGNGDITLFDAETGGIGRRLAGHASRVRQICFTRSLRTMLTVSDDKTALLWDLRPEASAASRNWDVLWNELASPDAARAYRAFWLAVGRSDAATFLRDKLKAELAAFDGDRIRRWLSELDDPKFDVREKAMQALTKLGPSIVPLVRRELEKENSPEKRRRLSRLLAEMPKERPPATMRLARA